MKNSTVLTKIPPIRIREDLDYPDPLVTEELLWFSMRDELIADRDNQYYEFEQPIKLFTWSAWMLRNKTIKDSSHLISELRYWLKFYANVFRWIHEDDLKLRLLKTADKLLMVMEPNIQLLAPDQDKRDKNIKRWKDQILPNKDDIDYYVDKALIERDTMVLNIPDNPRNIRRFIKNIYYVSKTNENPWKGINQRLGKRRKEETYNAVWLSIEVWNDPNQKPTQKLIAEMTNRCLRTVNTCMKENKDLKDLLKKKQKSYTKQKASRKYANKTTFQIRRDKSNMVLTDGEKMCKTVHKLESFNYVANCTFFTHNRMLENLRPVIH